jgi:hypothetical protein
VFLSGRVGLNIVLTGTRAITQTILAHENVILTQVHGRRQLAGIANVSVFIDWFLRTLTTLLDNEEGNQRRGNRSDSGNCSTNGRADW